MKQNDLDNQFRDIEKEKLKVARYLNTSGIANSGFMKDINGMIQAGRTYKEIIEFAGKKNLKLTPKQISRHKEMLPWILEYFEEPEENKVQNALQKAETRVGNDIPQAIIDVNQTELALTQLQQTIAANKTMVMNSIWSDLIPKMQEVILTKIDVNNVDLVTFTEAIDALSSLVSTAMKMDEPAKTNPGVGISINGNGAVQVNQTSDSNQNTSDISSSSLNMLDEINNILTPKPAEPIEE